MRITIEYTYRKYLIAYLSIKSDSQELCLLNSKGDFVIVELENNLNSFPLYLEANKKGRKKNKPNALFSHNHNWRNVFCAFNGLMSCNGIEHKNHVYCVDCVCAIAFFRRRKSNRSIDHQYISWEATDRIPCSRRTHHSVLETHTCIIY